MSNLLENGAVLPSGLLDASSGHLLDGFKKTYQNSYLRVGLIKETYNITDFGNLSKQVPEYDVLVWEQNEDRGATVIVYKNCPAATGFGSVADFFEAKLRKLKKKTSKGTTPQPSGQNGAIVLLLCLNGMSDKGIIVSFLSHPDRKTTLTGSDLHLEGEYNGVNIKVNGDGSTALTFNGATDNDGNVTNPSQGTTTLQIKNDGSFVLNHSTITLDLERSGDATLTVTGNGNITINANNNVTINAGGDINANCQNATITAQKTATVEGTLVKLGKNAVEAVMKGNTFQKIFDNHIHGTGVGPTSVPTTSAIPSLSKKVVTE